MSSYVQIRGVKKDKKGFFFSFFYSFSGHLEVSSGAREENRTDMCNPVPLIDHSMKIGTSQ